MGPRVTEVGEAKHPNQCGAQLRIVTALVSILEVTIACTGKFTQVSQGNRGAGT